MEEERRFGIISISFNCLDNILCLPDGNEIVDVECGMYDRLNYQFKIMVKGPDMPLVNEGEYPKNVIPIYEDYIDNGGTQNTRLIGLEVEE